MDTEASVTAGFKLAKTPPTHFPDIADICNLYKCQVKVALWLQLINPIK